MLDIDKTTKVLIRNQEETIRLQKAVFAAGGKWAAGQDYPLYTDGHYGKADFPYQIEIYNKKMTISGDCHSGVSVDELLGPTIVSNPLLLILK